MYHQSSIKNDAFCARKEALICAHEKSVKKMSIFKKRVDSEWISSKFHFESGTQMVTQLDRLQAVISSLNG